MMSAHCNKVKFLFQPIVINLTFYDQINWISVWPTTVIPVSQRTPAIKLPRKFLGESIQCFHLVNETELNVLLSLSRNYWIVFEVYRTTNFKSVTVKFT